MAKHRMNPNTFEGAAHLGASLQGRHTCRWYLCPATDTMELTIEVSAMGQTASAP